MDHGWRTSAVGAVRVLVGPSEGVYGYSLLVTKELVSIAPSLRIYEDKAQIEKQMAT